MIEWLLYDQVLYIIYINPHSYLLRLKYLLFEKITKIHFYFFLETSRRDMLIVSKLHVESNLLLTLVRKRGRGKGEKNKTVMEGIKSKRSIYNKVM